MTKKTVTSAFGVGRREGHDASSFYSRKIYSNNGKHKDLSLNNTGESLMPRQENFYDNWYNKIYCQTSEYMPIPDSSVGLAFTSPPYNVGKDYDQDMDLNEYLSLIEQVGKEIYRVLVAGGRYVINIANLGRKPYIPLHRYFYEIHERIGFLPMGEIIWQKAQGANGSCAWGSWASAKAPRIRDVHEYLLVFAKEVATVSSRLFEEKMQDGLKKSKRGIHEGIMRQFLRVNGERYMSAGIEKDGTAYLLEIPSIDDLRKTYKVERITAVPALDREQSVVKFELTMTNIITGETCQLNYHAEIRWSHGPFCGNPEAKLYKDFRVYEVPFFRQIYEENSLK